MRVIAACCLALLLAAGPAQAQDAPSFRDKQVQMVIGYAAGGTVDLFGRLIAPFLSQYLPGNPSFVVRNMPGAEGVIGLNHFVTQTRPDGLSLAVGGATQVDPLHLQTARAAYDISKLVLVGGNGRDGTAVLIRREAEPRLLDKSQPPVVMGALAAIRTGMQMPLFGAEYLGWNIRWVLGYPSPKELVLGLQRGEIDMTSISDPIMVGTLRATGGYSVLTQSGYLKDGRLLARAELAGPLLSDLVADKIADPVARQAFAYWRSFIQVGQYLALAPGTPDAIAAAYRRAFDRAITDPDFAARLEATGNALLPQDAAAATELFAALGATSPEVIRFMQAIAKKQGLELGG